MPTLAVADEAWWFVDESAAHSAATLVAETRGCRLVSLHAADADDHESVRHPWRTTRLSMVREEAMRCHRATVTRSLR